MLEVHQMLGRRITTYYSNLLLLELWDSSADVSGGSLALFTVSDLRSMSRAHPDCLSRPMGIFMSVQ
jgi:hypothetical protein